MISVFEGDGARTVMIDLRGKYDSSIYQRLRKTSEATLAQEDCLDNRPHTRVDSANPVAQGIARINLME